MEIHRSQITSSNQGAKAWTSQDMFHLAGKFWHWHFWEPGKIIYQKPTWYWQFTLPVRSNLTYYIYIEKFMVPHCNDFPLQDDHTPFSASSCMRGGKRSLRKTWTADGLSDGWAAVSHRTNSAWDSNSAAHVGGNVPFNLRSLSNTYRSILVENWYQSSNKTTPKLYISTCKQLSWYS